DEIAGLAREVGLAPAGADRFAISAADAATLVIDAPPARVAEALARRDVITHGLHLPGLEPAGDTSLAAYLGDPGRSEYDIDDLGREFGIELDVAADEETAQGVRTAAAALRLHDELLTRVRDRQMEDLYRQIELPLVPVLAEMESTGIHVDIY